ncbi:MAG: S-methyl-5'-thioadenosine phosphorylase [Spirochaetes bacterium]|nr:S-methyl-5'-thioadenosine phosphorylase [Spirochaetota bacterium]
MGATATIGIIGGSGVYSVEGVTVTATVNPKTPFGKTSDSITIARIGGRDVAFLPRHGIGHRILPSEVPVKANIWALKSLGVHTVIAISSVGSLKEKIPPRDFVIPSQIIDRTRSRVNSFFGDGIVGHVTFDKPFCPALSDTLHDVILKAGHPVHRDEAYICMEGPQFSTKAESELYRSWGGGVIGMTALPEAKLAREAEMCYAMIAMATDYDCWHPAHDAVTLDMIIGNAQANSSKVKAFLPDLINAVPDNDTCACRRAAAHAIMTDPKYFPHAAKKKLALLYGKYWK